MSMSLRVERLQHKGNEVRYIGLSFSLNLIPRIIPKDNPEDASRD